MNSFLTHFQLTPKNAVAYLIAFAAYVQNMGHMPETPRQWGVVAVGFLLSTLVPSRDGQTRSVMSESEGGEP